MRRVVLSILMGAVLIGAAGVAAAGEAEKKPDAKVEFSAGSVAAGIGYSWGSGVLTYKGKEYRFKVDGLSVGDVGVVQVDAAGDVYELKKVPEFSGIYTALTAQATVGGGAGAIRMKNQNGVLLQLISRTQGVDLKLATSGLKITMEK